MLEFWSRLFDTSGFTPRWNCGTWDAGLGWLHILADAATFGAYTAIPLVLAYFMLHRRDVPFPRVFWLFGLFIFSCGFGHLVESIIFWHPVYRFSGLVKLTTASVSWVTVVALARVMPTALALPGLKRLNEELQGQVAQRREAERVMQAAKGTAVAANRAKSEFLANISHELRTPMNAIIGMTELALEEPLSPNVRDCLGTAKDSADVLLSLLNEILDFSRIESGRFTLERDEFKLRSTVNETVRTLRIRADNKRLKLVRDVNDEVPDRLVGDSLRLRQVLANLVGNAIKFTEQGEVVIGVGVDSQTSTATCLKFSVRDTGIGIAAEDRERIFAPFTQADSSTTRMHGGTGLGLTICGELVRLMGGRIWVTSELGQGSTFCFTAWFDRVAEPHGAMGRAGGEHAAAAEADAPPRSLRVLVAEDVPANQKLVRMILQKRGHEIDVAENGKQALEMVRAGRYDAVLMDVQMPVVDGLQATAAIRAEQARDVHRLPIIAMTAHAMRGDRERCLAAGMDAYVAKPVDSGQLIHLIEKFGGQRAAAGAVTLTDNAVTTSTEPSADTNPPMPPAIESLKVFDAAQALARMGGSRQLLAEMIGWFRDDAPKLIEEMSAAAVEHDWRRLARVAHNLKGLASNLDAEQVIALARQIEQQADAQASTAIGPLLDQLRQTLDRLLSALPTEP
ncbi:MAG TPA: ATP-binding protein [Pirellulales bacterium]|jgi:signal transduction histidine kinase/CheY-like chemotaxis protein|nr:ATP-binding protein [Pirellulales bacterium]